MPNNPRRVTRTPRPSDAEMVHAAYVAAGRSQRRFAEDVLGVSLSAMTDWLRGEPCFAPVVRVCWAIVERPALADEIAARFPG